MTWSQVFDINHQVKCVSEQKGIVYATSFINPFMYSDPLESYLLFTYWDTYRNDVGINYQCTNHK